MLSNMLPTNSMHGVGIHDISPASGPHAGAGGLLCSRPLPRHRPSPLDTRNILQKVSGILLNNNG